MLSDYNRYQLYERYKIVEIDGVKKLEISFAKNSTIKMSYIEGLNIPEGTIVGYNTAEGIRVTEAAAYLFLKGATIDGNKVMQNGHQVGYIAEPEKMYMTVDILQDTLNIKTIWNLN